MSGKVFVKERLAFLRKLEFDQVKERIVARLTLIISIQNKWNAQLRRTCIVDSAHSRRCIFGSR